MGGDSFSGGGRTVYRILAGAVLLLALSIAAGTVYALAVRHTVNNQPPRESGPVEPSGGGRTFTGIGRIRVSTAPPAPAAVVISVTFPYNHEDRAFTEELASRTGDFRAAVSRFFGSMPEEALGLLGEEGIKAALLDQFNALLRLGSIEVLYFNDFMIIR